MNFKKSEPAVIWKRLHCQRITSKNTRPWWVDTWARDTVRWYWSADTLFWQLSIDNNIDVQSAFSWAPKVARKCESKHWYACGADGRSVARSVTWLPNFLRWVDLFTHGAPLARFEHGAPLSTTCGNSQEMTSHQTQPEWSLVGPSYKIVGLSTIDWTLFFNEFFLPEA